MIRDFEATDTEFPRFTLADGTLYDVIAHNSDSTEVQHVIRFAECQHLDFIVVTRRAHVTRDWQTFDLYQTRRSSRSTGKVELLAEGYIADGVARLDRYREEVGPHPAVGGYRAAIRACVRFIRRERPDY